METFTLGKGSHGILIWHTRYFQIGPHLMMHVLSHKIIHFLPEFGQTTYNFPNKKTSSLFPEIIYPHSQDTLPSHHLFLMKLQLWLQIQYQKYHAIKLLASPTINYSLHYAPPKNLCSLYHPFCDMFLIASPV